MFPSVINLLANSADMASRIFIPNLVTEFGGSNFTVGLIVGIYGATSFLSYSLFGMAADKYGRQFILRLGLLLSAAAFLLQIAADSEKSLFIVRAIVGFCFGMAPAALVAYAYESKKSIGKFSSYGSLGWVAGSLAAGLIASYKEIFILSSILLFIAFLISLKMPPATAPEVQAPIFPAELIRKNLKVYFQYFIRHLGATISWTIFPLFLVGIGASYFWIGFMSTINAATQFLVMRKLDAIDNRKLVYWGLLLSAVVFFAYSIATDYRQIIPVQIVLGFAWSFLYVGSLKSLLESNVERASAAGLLNSTINFAGIVGPIISGVITAFASFRVAFAFSGLLCLVGIAYKTPQEKT